MYHVFDIDTESSDQIYVLIIHAVGLYPTLPDTMFHEFDIDTESSIQIYKLIIHVFLGAGFLCTWQKSCQISLCDFSFKKMGIYPAWPATMWHVFGIDTEASD